MQKIIRIVFRSASVLALIVFTIYMVRAFDSRHLPDLGPEYRINFDNEFQARDESVTEWSDYLAIEVTLEQELDTKIDPDGRAGRLLDRYATQSVTNPDRFDGNWNLSYELKSASPQGVAVMLHGLSDSPYSMLHTAQAAVGAGYNVVVPRLPGHGFAVSGLLDAGWDDWAAVTRIAIRRAEELRQADQPLLLVGYSNGGLLALEYAMLCNDDEALPCPDNIVLLSPALAVSPVAIVANLHSAVSWLPYFEKFRWLSVLPEIDPFKYTSFPKRAAWEIRKASKRVNQLLHNKQYVDRLPPILTFQSVVDNTVSSGAVVSNLYERLPANGSELVVYDVNRNDTLVHLMRSIPGDPIEFFSDAAPLNYSLTVLRNANANGLDITIANMPAGSEAFAYRESRLDWPLGVYSLSHIAIPFPTIDPLYGDGSGNAAGDVGLVLGAIAPRGELGVLSLSPAFFLRTRHNPFFGFQVSHTADWLQVTH